MQRIGTWLGIAAVAAGCGGGEVASSGAGGSSAHTSHSSTGAKGSASGAGASGATSSSGAGAGSTASSSGAGAGATTSSSGAGAGGAGGGASSTAASSGAGAGGGGTASSTGAGGSKPSTYPRLLVASEAGVAIWDNADLITVDTAPTATLGGVGSAIGFALEGDLLFVTSSDASTALYRFAGASTLATGAVPASSMTAAAFGGPFAARHTKLQIDAAGDLWIQSSRGAGSIQLVKKAAAATAVDATFTHSFQQIEGMVFDQAGGRLFGGQISGAGIRAWNSAASVIGAGTANGDFQLDPASAWHMTIARGRLYTSAYGPADLRIWNGIAGVTGSKAPDATLTGLCDRPSSVGNELRFSTVTPKDELVVVHNEIVTGGQLERVCIFAAASALSASRPADAVAADASLLPGGDDRAWLTAGGVLFVEDSTGVAIFKNATTTPVFVAKLKTGINKPHDILVLE